jgi:hypothetical protein
LLKTVTTPAGGEITYTYEIHQFGHEQRGNTQVNSLVVTSRAVGGGERPWTNSYQNYTADDPCVCESTTVTTPSGTRIGYWNNSIGSPTVPSLGGDWGLRWRKVTDHEIARAGLAAQP